MHDNLVQGPHSFHPVRVDIVRLLHGVHGSALKAQEIRSTVDITWIRETRARAILLVNGNEVMEGSSYNDWYGLGTSCRNAVEDAENWMRTYAPNGEPNIEVRVVCSIIDTPTLGLGDEKYGRRYYHPIPKDMLFYIEVPDAGLDAVPFGEKQVLGTREHSEIVVWSSNNDGAEKAAAMARWVDLLGQEPNRKSGSTGHVNG